MSPLKRIGMLLGINVSELVKPHDKNFRHVFLDQLEKKEK